MKTAVEPLEGNKVKLSVEVDELEFDKALDSAFRRIAHEVRLPGFRPGKAPRKLLERHVDLGAARQEALREALPHYYAVAIKEQELDAIAAGQVTITAGEDAGPVAFDAVVEVRPTVAIPGYAGLQVTIPSPVVAEADLDAQIDRLRGNDAVLETVDRPARDGDLLTLDLKGVRQPVIGEAGQDDDGDEVTEPRSVIDADDYSYELGSGQILEEVDIRLQGAVVDDLLEFDATPPGESETISFAITVKEVKEKILPEVTDEWASEASEFETVEELRADLAKRMGMIKKLQARMAIEQASIDALVELVEDEAPAPLLDQEVERRLHEMSHRLQEQGVDYTQYLAAIAQTQEAFLQQVRTGCIPAVKADLALRALSEMEALEATDDDIDLFIERMAAQYKMKPAKVRKQLDRGDQMQAVRSDVRKSKALEWLVEHVDLVDEAGNTIDRSDLDIAELIRPADTVDSTAEPTTDAPDEEPEA